MHSVATLEHPAAAESRVASLFTAPAEAGLEAETAAVQRWVLDFLSKSHPDLGRKGPVCPFTSPAIKKDLFWAAFLRGKHLGREDISQALTAVIQEFQEKPPRNGEDSQLKSVVLVLPDLKDTDLIDNIQMEFKSIFVRYGLMVGQFYPGCEVGGLWNPHFRALDAPYPMIALRHMTESDFPFLAESAEWLNAYFAKFAPRIPTRVRSSIVGAIVESPA